MAARRVGVAAAFLLIGLAMVAGAAYAYHAIVQLPQTWPRVEASVVSSRVINPRRPSNYSPEIVFRLADGAQTRDVRVAPSWSSSSYSAVQGHVAQYPEGARVSVAVNPTDPSDVRYDLSLSVVNLLGPGVLALLGFVFAGVGFFSLRSEDTEVTPLPLAMQAEVTAAAGRRTGRLVGTLFVPIGLVIIVIAVLMARSNARMLREWPRVGGRVIASRVVAAGSSSRGSNQPLYDTAVSFRYVVKGVLLESETTYGVGTDRRAAERRATSYAVGTTHDVWHRPDDPRVIRFDLGNRFGVFALPGALVLMGLVFAGLGALIWTLAGRESSAAMETSSIGAEEP